MLSRRVELFSLTAVLTAAWMQIALPVRVHARSEPDLSAAESAVVQRQIATLHSATDRKLAEGWSNAKKVAETLCRPAALLALKQQLPGTDRVFLGSDDPASLTLESDAELTGSGSARAGNNWRDFTFTCDLDPATGKATRFTPTLTHAAHSE